MLFVQSVEVCGDAEALVTSERCCLKDVYNKKQIRFMLKSVKETSAVYS